MFGQKRFSGVNSRLNAAFADKHVLIAAHRGSWHGNVIQNTSRAYRAAIMMGADMLETDTTISKDGTVYSLHDGVEPVLLGLSWNAMHLTQAQIESQTCHNSLGVPCLQKVETLDTVFDNLKNGELINIDRSWRARGKVLEVLDQHPHMLSQALVKAPLRERQVLEQLNAHEKKYMFMPICYSLSDVKEALAYENINTVGVELIAKNRDSEMFSKEAIRYIHEQGLFCWVNALVITDYDPEEALYAGLDDDVSINEGPEKGWGALMDMGIDLIQTDWPSLLRDYRRARFGV